MNKSDDLISRQALCEYALNQKDKCVTPNDIMRFPSAQQDCTDCAEYDNETKSCPKYCETIRKTVEEVKERTGRWIDDNCSECGQYVYHGDVRNFCPNCGAKMEEGE